MDFHHIFKTCLTKGDLELIKFWGVSGNGCCHGNAFNIFGVVNAVAVSQSKLYMDFSSNFQDVFYPRGSRADYVLGGIWLLSRTAFTFIYINALHAKSTHKFLSSKQVKSVLFFFFLSM